MIVQTLYKVMLNYTCMYKGLCTDVICIYTRIYSMIRLCLVYIEEMYARVFTVFLHVLKVLVFLQNWFPDLNVSVGPSEMCLAV
jgi:hypothetical protein